MIKREQGTSSTRQTSAAPGRQTSPELSNLNLERVAGYDAYDKNNEHIGKISAIWTDHNGQPAYLGVRTFWLLGKTHVVPAYGAMVNNQDERIRLPYLQEDVKNAPSYDPEAELDYAKEQEVFSYYRSRGQRLPELQAERPAATQAETRETTRTARSAEEARIPLHEEQMKVGKRQVEVGGVRLRKIIRTETVNQPVELRHEEVVVERVPASERRTGERAFQNEELYIPLCREEAVVEKETRVREEVRAHKTASTERQNVTGQVRREDVQVEKGAQTEVRSGQGATMRQRTETTPRTTGRETTGTTHERSTGRKSVFCLARDEAQASRIVDDLKAGGFSNNDISVLLPDKGSTREFAHEKNTKAPEGAVTGVGTGGILGGVLGWLAGVGALAIPGVGPFIAAGPIAAALSGAAVGATAGGIVGALVGMGIPEYEAKRYESRLREGRILISVHSDNSEETRRAKEIFERHGAEDIATAGEESVSDRERGEYRRAA